MVRIPKKVNTNVKSLLFFVRFVQTLPVRYAIMIETSYYRIPMVAASRRLLNPNTIETKEESSGREPNISDGIDFKLDALLQGHLTMEKHHPCAFDEYMGDTGD